MEALDACAGCGKLGATMACPTCTKMMLPQNSFCGQECFKENWDKHKKIHKKARNKLDESHLDDFRGYKFTGKLRPMARKVQRPPPKGIPAPDYAVTGEPAEEIRQRKVNLATPLPPDEIPTLREACVLGRKVLDLAGTMCTPGTTGEQVDDAVHEFIVANGAYPSPLNYYDFPKSVCISVNEVICHGIPDIRPFEEGDIVNVDVTVYYKGFHADLNDTFYVGDITKINPETKRLVQGAYNCLMAAIRCCKPGTMYREIGNAIAKVADESNLSIVRTYCGHGVGKLFHCAPNVPHYAKSKAVGTMKVGHVFTIEPMINLGDYHDETWPDNWTAVTSDGSWSAQFEHTLIITEKGCEVLTGRLPDSPPFQWEHDYEVEAGIPPKTA